MPYFLGIDGGGTKTRFLLADETKVLAKAMTGGSNIVRLGEDQAREALQSGVRQVCAAGQLAPEQICAVCIGVAGAARPEVAAKIRGILAEANLKDDSAKVEVVGDSVIALDAAFGDGPGVIAISGTGSIAYGRDAAGHTARAGGWGFAISDEGSGHWIGRRAVMSVLRARDDDAETALTSAILGAWKLSSIDELVQQANATPPPDFPWLLRPVLRAADAGDAIAHALLAEAGAKLANLASTALRRLVRSGSEPLPVAVTGSVFRQSKDVRQIFCDALAAKFPGIDVRRDIIDPADGALARAKRL